MIKVVKELKKHFSDMKNEFYNQIAAENMYSNYNYNSKFLRVIEIRLKFYEWMISKAFTKDALDEKRTLKDTPEKDAIIKTKLFYEQNKEAEKVYGFSFPHIDAYKTTPGAAAKRRQDEAVEALFLLKKSR